MSEDRNEYMRVYMQDRRSATKLGLDINTYRELANAGNLPVNTPVVTSNQTSKRTYTKQATTSNDTTPIWTLNELPIWLIYAIIGSIVLGLFGVFYAVSFFANRQIQDDNEVQYE